MDVLMPAHVAELHVDEIERGWGATPLVTQNSDNVRMTPSVLSSSTAFISFWISVLVNEPNGRTIFRANSYFVISWRKRTHSLFEAAANIYI